ncbi:MAG: holo-ACP synthase [Selenomonadales bacterium]|nr:holo-ACP synthase [Selenomonadales bacterium]
MAPGIGIDMVEVARIARAIEKRGFKDRVFTSAEQAYCDSRGMQSTLSYAARFAGKEAVLKALGTGLRGGKLTEIEILPNELGAPTVMLSGYFQAFCKAQGISEIVISLTHDKTYAMAQAMAWRDAK